MNFSLYKKLHESLADIDDEDVCLVKSANVVSHLNNPFNSFIQKRLLMNNDSSLSADDDYIIELLLNAGKEHHSINFEKIIPENTLTFITIFRRAYQLLGDEASYNWIDTRNVTSLQNLFKGKTEFNGDISEWDVSNVENMNNTFFNCKSFNQDLSNWNVDKVSQLSATFIFANEDFLRQMYAKFQDKIKRSQEDPDHVAPIKSHSKSFSI